MVHAIGLIWRRLRFALLVFGLAACGSAPPSAGRPAPTQPPLPTRSAPTAAPEQPTSVSEQPSDRSIQPAQAPAVDAQPQPILGFAPSAGGPGTTVSVWGSGYPANAQVSVRLGSPQPTGKVLANVFADAGGKWQTSLVIPDRLPSGELITGGDMVLVVTDAANQPLASAPFGFVAGAEPPAPPAAQTDWPGADWQILTSGDFNGDGAKEVVYVKPAQIQPRATFYDAYLSSQARLISAAMIAQGYGDQARILLTVDAQGMQAEGAQLGSFGADASGPAGFLLALDPGSTTFINLLPLDAAGEHRGQEIGLNWNQAEQGYRLASPAP